MSPSSHTEKSVSMANAEQLWYGEPQQSGMTSGSVCQTDRPASAMKSSQRPTAATPSPSASEVGCSRTPARRARSGLMLRPPPHGATHLGVPAAARQRHRQLLGHARAEHPVQLDELAPIQALEVVHAARGVVVAEPSEPVGSLAHGELA